MSAVDPAGVRRGARWLVGRQIAGIIVTAASLLVITRVLGPTHYGAYTAAFAIWFAIQSLSELSLDIWIVRHPPEYLSQAVKTAQSALLVLGVAGSVACFSLASLASKAAGTPELETLLRWMSPLVLVVTASQACLSLVERDLDFGYIGIVEFSGQLLFAGTAVILVLVTEATISLVCALAAQQIWLVAGWVWRKRRTLPALGWDSALARAALAFCVPTVSSTVFNVVRSNGGQLLIARAFGVETLGLVNLCYRLLEQAAFLRQPVVRMSLALFTQLRIASPRIDSHIERALVLLTVVTGFPILCLAWAAPTLIPIVFGPAWSGAVPVVIAMAPGALMLGVLMIYMSISAVHSVPWLNVAASAVSAAAFLSTLAITADSAGPVAVGIAELTTLIAIIVFVIGLQRRVTKDAFALGALCLICFSIASLQYFVSPLLAATCIIPLMVPTVRQTLLAEVPSRILPSRFRRR